MILTGTFGMSKRNQERRRISEFLTFRETSFPQTGRLWNGDVWRYLKRERMISRVGKMETNQYGYITFGLKAGTSLCHAHGSFTVETILYRENIELNGIKVSGSFKFPRMWFWIGLQSLLVPKDFHFGLTSYASTN
jgi:hypothetical protein